MAVACAASFRADHLIFLTDVEGVLDENKQLRPLLTIEGAQRLIRSGAATGGMQAKLNAATAALRQGVGEVRIAPGAAPGILARLLRDETVGTRFVASGEPQ
jgi:acetylglutamate kinase